MGGCSVTSCLSLLLEGEVGFTKRLDFVLPSGFGVALDIGFIALGGFCLQEVRFGGVARGRFRLPVGFGLVPTSVGLAPAVQVRLTLGRGGERHGLFRPAS